MHEFNISLEELVERCNNLQAKAGQRKHITIDNDDGEYWSAHTDVWFGAQGSTAFEAVAELYSTLKRQTRRL